MSTYPNRCQHLKTNGTQCGSPALHRNRFCYFHKRYQDERIRLNTDRRRRGTATFFLPVLEDANSIQMSLMQIMRLLLTGQIEHKTASLLLYALQTASTNLRLTDFKPFVHEVILDPRACRREPARQTHLWNDEDFEDEEEEELDEDEQEIEKKVEEAAEKARLVARWEAKKRNRSPRTRPQTLRRGREAKGLGPAKPEVHAGPPRRPSLHRTPPERRGSQTRSRRPTTGTEARTREKAGSRSAQPRSAPKLPT